MANGKTRGVFDNDAVEAVIAGERDVGRWKPDGLLQSGPMALDAEAGEAKVGRAFGVDHGAAFEIGSGLKRGAGWIAADFQALGAFGGGEPSVQDEGAQNLGNRGNQIGR